jgi:trans-aconitate 2-methyltransferase
VTRWDPDQYLRFERERTQPCRDLVARLGERTPGRIVDLGCGTGTSTATLRARWPDAHLLGLDSSSEMIAAARRSDPRTEWVEADIAAWAPREPFDLIFSNAALHWLPDHEHLFPRLMQLLAPGGALAVQMPTNAESPAHRSVREVAATPPWPGRWVRPPYVASVGAPAAYYDLLAPHARTVELWQTEYQHVLPDAGAILEWIKGTTLRPYLDALPDAAQRTEFLSEVGRRLAPGYPPRADGQVLFPFRRLFFIAGR